MGKIFGGYPDDIILTARRFEAAGDGIADDTAALRRAFSSGKSIDLGAYTYRITDTITFSLTKDISIFGDRARIVFDASVAKGTGITIDTAGYNLRMSNFKIDANAKAHIGLWIENSTTTMRDLLLTDIEVVNAYRSDVSIAYTAFGIYCRGGWNRLFIDRPIINNTRVASGLNTGGLGASGICLADYAAKSVEVVVRNPDIRNTYSELSSDTSDMDAIKYLANNTTSPIPNNTIFRVLGGYFENNWGRAIKSQATQTIVDGPHIRRTAGPSVDTTVPEIDFQEGAGLLQNFVVEYDGYTSGTVFELQGVRTAGILSASGVVRNGKILLNNANDKIAQLFFIRNIETPDMRIEIDNIEVVGGTVQYGIYLGSVNAGVTMKLDLNNITANLSTATFNINGTWTGQNIITKVSNFVQLGTAKAFMARTAYHKVTSGGGNYGFTDLWDPADDGSGNLAFTFNGTIAAKFKTSGSIEYNPSAATSDATYYWNNTTTGLLSHLVNADTGSNGTVARLESASSSAGIAYGLLDIYRSGTNTTNRGAGITYALNDSNNNRQEYAYTGAHIVTATDGSEDGAYRIMFTTAGVARAGYYVFSKFGFGLNNVISVDNSSGIRFPTYTATQIADKTHAVNTTDKVAGKAVWDTTNHRLMIAGGTADVSNWYVADASVTVTPA